MSARLDELGLKFTVESMAELVTHSRYEDLQFFYDQEHKQWVIRWWHEADAVFDEEEWGAIIQADTLQEVLEEAVHGMFFS